MSHYHIDWSHKQELDWEPFNSSAEAEASAAQRVRPGETYTIEEQGEICPRCRAAFKLKTDHDKRATAVSSNVKYLWQQAVLDAFVALQETLGGKINIAQRAIAARLQEPQQPDNEERVAISDALRALRVLVEETRQKRESSQPGEKKDIV